MEGLAKQAFDAERAKSIALNTAIGIPAALLIGKGIHTEMTNTEGKKDIREPLFSLTNRKDRMQAVRTAFEDQFKNLDIPEIKNEHTKVEVQRSMFPWRDRYMADISLVDDKDESIDDFLGYVGSIYKDKDNQYTGYIDGISTREDMQGKGIGRNVENRMVGAFRDLGASKVRLQPAFDGPMVWAKKDFQYNLSPDSKPTFLKAYKKYTDEKGIPYSDLGDRPSDYPAEFLKELRDYEPFWKSIYYEKPIEKEAGLAKMALNAQKAREMAGQAGLYPVGNWKWALRNLRNGQGNLLHGRELTEAKNGIGSLSNNDYHAVQKMHRQVPPGVEISGEFQNGSLSRLTQGGEFFVQNTEDYMKNSRGLHTHPENGRISLLKDLKERDQMVEDWKELDQQLKEMDPDYESDPALILDLKRESGKIRQERLGVNLLENKRNPLFSSASDGDVLTLIDKMDKNRQPAIENIISPMTHVEGIHQLRPKGEGYRSRSIYFDRSPRKA